MIFQKEKDFSHDLALGFTKRRKGVALSTLFFCIFLFFLLIPLFLFILYPIALLFLRAFQGGDSLSLFAGILKKYRYAFWNSMESSFLSAFNSGLWDSTAKGLEAKILHDDFIDEPCFSALYFLPLLYQLVRKKGYY